MLSYFKPLTSRHISANCMLFSSVKPSTELNDNALSFSSPEEELFTLMFLKKVDKDSG